MSHNLVEIFFQFTQKTILNITKNKTKVFLPPKAEIRVSIAPPGPYSESDSRFLFGRSHRALLSFPSQASATIAKSKNPTTFAKRQREQEKKRKASDKLAKRAHRKAFGPPARDAHDVPTNPD